MQFYHYHIGGGGRGVKIQQGHHNRIPAGHHTVEIRNPGQAERDKKRERTDSGGAWGGRADQSDVLVEPGVAWGRGIHSNITILFIRQNLNLTRNHPVW